MAGHSGPHGGEDWRKTLRNASFRGAFFWVEREGADGGRRLAIHEFPLSEQPYVEDMGRQASRYEVTAYVAGGLAAAQGKSLWAACNSPGPATLVLPLHGTIAARCMEISMDRSKDKHGYIAFRIRFVAEGFALSGLGGAPHYKSRVRNKSKGMPPIMRAAFKRRYRGVALPDFVLKSAINTTQSYLAQWAVIADTSGLRGTKASKLVSKIGDMIDTIPALLDSGQTGHTYELTSFRATGEDVDTDDFATSIIELNEQFQEAASPDLAIASFRTMLDWCEGDELSAIPNTTKWRRREQENQDTLLALFRRSALAQLAIAATEASYPSRRDAVAMRVEVQTRFNSEIARLDSGDQVEVLNALRELQGLTCDYLSKLTATLAPVLQVETKALMPSIYWAYRLYEDATRADELSDRNRIKHPSFMPTVFEALAR